MAAKIQSLALACMLVQSGGMLAAETIEAVPRSPSSVANMQPLAMNIGGRMQWIDAASFAHQWPGVYVEAAFHGTALTIRFDDSVNEYRLHLDDAAPVPVAQPGPVDIRITGLADVDHRIRIEKVTESIGLTGVFGGLYIPLTDQPLTLPRRSRQIEFIGDSDMTGYGIRSLVRECTQDQVRLLSDTQVAYPALVAQHFDADYQINAASGRGMVRNYDGFSPEIALPLIYPNSLMDAGGSYADPTWQPQIIVVSLGGNDFATPLHDGESWPATPALMADFISTYSRFITTLHSAQPQATLLIILPYGGLVPEVQAPAFSDALQNALLATAGQIRLTQIDFLTLIDVKPEYTACDYHPSLRDQRHRAAWLTRYLDDHPGLWK